MPLVIVMNADAIPAIVTDAKAENVVRQIAGFKEAPSGLATEQDARAWLATLPSPSGWYSDAAEARAVIAQMRRNEPPMPPAELEAIRTRLDLTREAFGALIGYAGNSNSRHKQVWEMEKGKKPISAEKARAARALLAEAKMAEV